MLKLALIGDLHLSERSPRYAHTLEVLDWTIEDALTQTKEWNCGMAWGLLGDLFEGAPSPREYDDFSDRLILMAEVGDVFIALGNHEHYEALRFFRKFHGTKGNVVVAWNEVIERFLGYARLLIVPYPRRGRAPFHDLTDDGSIQGSLQAAAAHIGTSVRVAAARRGAPLIVAGHFTVEGMKTRDAEFELHSASEVVVPLAALDGAALTAVGHIHRAQVVRETPPVLGVGGLIRHSFAEAHDPKSYTLVTIDDDGRVTYEQRPVPARDMLVMTVPWRGDGTDAKSTAESAQAVAGWEVKLTVEIPEDRLSTFNPAAFDPIKAAAALFVLDKKTISVQRTRAAEIAKAVTLGDQLAAWGQATEQSIDVPRLATKLAEIEA